MIILIQVVLKYVLFQKFDLRLALSTSQFLILVLATVLIAIAGYIINDINDVKADIINKPDKVFIPSKISFKKANDLYFTINLFGLLLGLYLSYSIDNISFFTIFIIVSLLLNRYSTQLKNKYLIGNLTVSFIIFLTVLITAIFDLVPVTNSYNNQIQLEVFNLVLIISFFAFCLTLLREIIKDLEDLKGDRATNANTLPIAFGVKKTKTILVWLSFVLFIAVLYFSYSLKEDHFFGTIYLISFVALPLLYFIFQIRKKELTVNYHKLSILLKAIMLLGILTILFL